MLRIPAPIEARKAQICRLIPYRAIIVVNFSFTLTSGEPGGRRKLSLTRVLPLIRARVHLVPPPQRTINHSTCLLRRLRLSAARKFFSTTAEAGDKSPRATRGTLRAFAVALHPFALDLVAAKSAAACAVRDLHPVGSLFRLDERTD